ncbi:MAG: polysaccharide biosynthesis/export family protein [Thermodesulfobacteriota bacterium]|nr:polysaccharide biosynthesis/export family protein [Thermodesulfobacteriota bacterium]
MKNFRIKASVRIFILILILALFPNYISQAQEGGSGNAPVEAGNIPRDEKPVVDDSYIIGPSDILEIQVWKEPDFSRVVPVRADGMITLPLLNDVKAAGFTPLQLKKDLEEKIKDFVELPEVSVIVKESLGRRIYIIGKVQKPGEYLLSKDMTVLQALSVAGGLAEWADSDDIVIIRRVGDEAKRIFFDYEKVISGRKPEQNIYLQPNDTIIIP